MEGETFLHWAVIQNILARHKPSDQSFRQERPVVSRICEYELARALRWRFHGISIPFLTTAVHHLNQRSAFSNKMAFPNTPASSFRLIPGEWLFLLPRQERAQAAHSPAPSWPHLTACTSAVPAEKVHSPEITPHQLEGQWPTNAVGDDVPVPRGQGKSRQAMTALPCRKTALNCGLMMAAAIPEQNWPRWVELQTAFRASCLALQLWAPLQQSRRHVHICQAERALRSQHGSGGLPGNYPALGTDSSRKVKSSTFTSSECTWKGTKILSPTSATWHPQTADSHPCASFELRTSSFA